MDSIDGSRTQELSRADDHVGVAQAQSVQAGEELYRQIRFKAMDLLARREHSAKELTNKLLMRYERCEELIVSAVASLRQANLQSDERYAEAYVAMRKTKGYGPQRIALELRARGVEAGLVQEKLLCIEHDWFASAQQVWQKKFDGAAVDLKERAKQARFLQYRGFSHDQVASALDDAAPF